MKPRLTEKALRGLGTLAGLVDAGGSEEITGYDEATLRKFAREGSPENLLSWDAVVAACHWIRGMQGAVLSVRPRKPE